MIMRPLAAISAMVFLALLSARVPAFAQSYPTKPVRVLIPWPPSGSADIVGRIVFQQMSASLGQQFVIDNRGGASGSIGSDIVAKAPPDGYTIMVHTATHVANPHLYRKLPYDTLNDFVGVGLLCAQLGMLVAHPSLPVKSVKQLIALAKARPDEIVFASAGNGSFPHLATALLMSMTSIRMVHVPYKGAGPAAASVVAGETQVLLVSAATVLPHVKSNRLRAIAVPSAMRLKQFPEIPTIAESGVPGYEMTPWIGVFAPARIPRTIVERLNAEIRRTLDDPETSGKLYHSLLNPWYMTSEEFAKRIRADYDKYEKLVKLTGAKID